MVEFPKDEHCWKYYWGGRESEFSLNFHLHMGQVTLFELLQHSHRSLLVELPQSINGPLIQISICHQACSVQIAVIFTHTQLCTQDAQIQLLTMKAETVWYTHLSEKCYPSFQLLSGAAQHRWGSGSSLCVWWRRPWVLPPPSPGQNYRSPQRHPFSWQNKWGKIICLNCFTVVNHNCTQITKQFYTWLMGNFQFKALWRFWPKMNEQSILICAKFVYLVFNPRLCDIKHHPTFITSFKVEV